MEWSPIRQLGFIHFVVLLLSEAVHRRELIASDNRRLAQALVRQGKAAEALSHVRRAVEIYTRLGSHHVAAPLRECEA